MIIHPKGCERKGDVSNPHFATSFFSGLFHKHYCYVYVLDFEDVCYNEDMNRDETEAEVVKLDAKIEIEDRRYDRTDKHFLENKNRRILLVSAELVIFMYLFSDLQNMVPDELYGQIFFAAGVILAIVSLVLSFIHCRPIIWPEPIGPIEIEKIDSMHTKLEWKEVIYDDYRACNTECKKILSNLAKTLKYSLFCFVISVIILAIIKYF